MNAEAFLQATYADARQPVYAVVGEERFLRRLVMEKLQQLLLGTEADELNRSVWEGESVSVADVLDWLQTISFFGGKRLAMVRDADTFVSRFRDSLEKYIARPSAAGTLVLEVKKWTATTRLARMLPDAATIRCDPLKPYALAGWCVKWSAHRHGKQLARDAAELLVHLAGTEMGILDQEIAKLASYVGESTRIAAADVDRLVGHGRAETAWEMLDALAARNYAVAFGVLNRLLEQGESPIMVLGAISWQLRKVAHVFRMLERGESLDAAMAAAGLYPSARQRVQLQLRQMRGGPKAIYRCLLEADAALKSTQSLSPQGVLERLLAKLAASTDDPASAKHR